MATAKYHVLGSSSKANAFIFSDGETTIAIDNGFSKTKWQLMVSEAGYDPTKFDAVFLTHMHQDHFRGVSNISQKFRIPLYANSAILNQGVKAYKPTAFDHDSTINIKGLSITAFQTYHDSPGSSGFHFSLGDKKFTLITDTGITSKQMFEYAINSHVVFLESNYCPLLLEDGPYPPHLKRRIDSCYGHLSNVQAMEFLKQLIKTDNIIEEINLCHLSEINNSPSILEDYILDYMTFPLAKYLRINICSND